MKNSDKSAYPVSVSSNDCGDVFWSHDIEGGEGLTKREYFAGLAMQGFITGTEVPEGFSIAISGLATSSVEAADALLAELEKNHEE